MEIKEFKNKIIGNVLGVDILCDFHTDEQYTHGGFYYLKLHTDANIELGSLICEKTKFDAKYTNKVFKNMYKEVVNKILADAKMWEGNS